MALDINGYNSAFNSFVQFAQQRVEHHRRGRRQLHLHADGRHAIRRSLWSPW